MYYSDQHNHSQTMNNSDQQKSQIILSKQSLTITKTVILSTQNIFQFIYFNRYTNQS